MARRRRQQIDTKELLARIDKFLQAETRLLRQLSPEVFRGDYQGEKLYLVRIMRNELHYWDMMLEATSSGYWSADPLYEELHEEEVDWIDSKDPQALADYCEDLRRRFNEWAAGASPQDFEKPTDGYYGEQTLGQLLSIGLGHIAHHLKGWYAAVRDEAGVPLVDPLTDKDFEGIISLSGAGPKGTATVDPSREA